MDYLNTHQSEVVVRLVAQLEAKPIELGEPGESDIFKSMATRVGLASAVWAATPNGYQGFTYI